MKANRILSASAFALTLLLGCVTSARAVVPDQTSVYSIPFNSVTESSGPFDLKIPQFNPASGTLSKVKLLLSFAGQLTTLASQDGIHDCGCGFTNASSTLAMTFIGPDVNSSAFQSTSPSTGLLLFGTQGFVIQSKPISNVLENDLVAPVSGLYLGTGSVDLTVTPTVTTNGTVAGPGTTLSSSLSLAGAATVVYTYVPLAPVPEPSTWAMTSLGLAGLFAFRRRR